MKAASFFKLALGAALVCAGLAAQVLPVLADQQRGHGGPGTGWVKLANASAALPRIR